jgi:hypothetical protein
MSTLEEASQALITKKHIAFTGAFDHCGCPTKSMVQVPEHT